MSVESEPNLLDVDEQGQISVESMLRSSLPNESPVVVNLEIGNSGIVFLKDYCIGCSRALRRVEKPLRLEGDSPP